MVKNFMLQPAAINYADYQATFVPDIQPRENAHKRDKIRTTIVRFSKDTAPSQ